MLKILNQKKTEIKDENLEELKNTTVFLEKSAQNTGIFLWLFDKTEKHHRFFGKKIPKTLNFSKNNELKKTTDF